MKYISVTVVYIKASLHWCDNKNKKSQKRNFKIPQNKR